MLLSRKLRLRFVPILGLALLAVLATPPAIAAEVWDTVPSLDVVRSRLDLTPEQEAKLTPLFEQRVGELQQLKDELAKATSKQQKRSLLKGAKNGGKSFNSQVEAVLDASQKSEWRELRAESREKMKERYEQKQDSQ